VCDMVVKKFTSAISSPDEFLYLLAITLLVRRVSPSADVVYIRYLLHFHNVVYVINLLHFTQGCVYNIGETDKMERGHMLRTRKHFQQGLAHVYDTA